MRLFLWFSNTAPRKSENRQIIHSSFWWWIVTRIIVGGPNDYCNEEGVSLHIFQRRMSREPIILSPKTCQKSRAFVPFGGLRMFRAPIDRFFCTLGSFLMVEGCSLLGGRTAKRWCYAGHNKLPKRFHWQSTVFENYSKCRIWILTYFCLIKNWPICQLCLTVRNVARLARNVEWDFFCDFQTQF